MTEITGELLIKVVVAGFAAVGIEEWLKNFLPKGSGKWLALLMLPLAVGSFCAVDLLPLPVIGSLLTVGTVQLVYETLVQGFRAIIERVSGKVEGKAGDVASDAKRLREKPPREPEPPPRY